MPQKPEETANRRHEARAPAPLLDTWVRKQGLLASRHFTPCQTLDIDRGGMAITSPTLQLATGDKVVLRIDHEDGQHLLEGIVGYRHPLASSVQYGIIFIRVPYEFDTLLDRLLDDGKEGDAIEPSPSPAVPRPSGTPRLRLVKGTQRRAEKRAHLPGLVIRAARKQHFKHPLFMKCELVDIGCGGIGFHARALQQPLLSRVEIELCYGDQCFRVDGLVSFFHPDEQGGGRYGVEFLSVPPALTRLMDSLVEEE